LIAGLAGTFLMFTIYRSLPRPTNGKLDIILTTRTMLKYGLPLSVVAILTGFLTQFYNYILAIYVTNNAAIGNYSVALNFVVLITFFAVPVTTMLFPAFSKCDYKKDHETLRNVFQYSVKYAALIVVPVTAMVIALAQPAIETLFQERYTQAPLFLALLSVTYLYSAFGSLSIANLINGQGNTSFNLKMTILTAAIGFPLSFVLISNFGVIGLIITTLVVGLPALFIGLRFISRNYRLSVDWVSSLKILLSSALAAVLTFFIITKLPLHQINLTFGSVVLPISIALQQLVVGIIVFPVIFIISAILTRTISRNDIVSLREIADELGPLRKPVQGLLGLMERLIIILHLK